MAAAAADAPPAPPAQRRPAPARMRLCRRPDHRKKASRRGAPQQALLREIREELDTEIAVGEKITTVEYDYPEFHLSMDCFYATVTRGDLVLREHEAARWLEIGELDAVRWLPADRIVMEALKQADTKKP